MADGAMSEGMKMAKPLKPKEMDLLREVMRHAAPARDDLLAAAEANTLTREQREELCGLISVEFLRTGLAAGDEPNARGLELEALLDEVNRPNLMKGA
jgi:hypothetical protein